jgi:hypothetical protein
VRVETEEQRIKREEAEKLEAAEESRKEKAKEENLTVTLKEGAVMIPPRWADDLTFEVEGESKKCTAE